MLYCSISYAGVAQPLAVSLRAPFSVVAVLSSGWVRIGLGPANTEIGVPRDTKLSTENDLQRMPVDLRAIADAAADFRLHRLYDVN